MPYSLEFLARLGPDEGGLDAAVEFGAAGDPEAFGADLDLIPGGGEENVALGVGHPEAARHALQLIASCKNFHFLFYGRGGDKGGGN
jgi:hypothetical protein